jgi:hypothetical protein
MAGYGMSTAGRERLREAFHRHRDGCNGKPHRSWYRGENKCDALAAVALAHDRPSGSGLREVEYLTWDGRRLVVSVSDEDPGDMGEPRSFESEGVSYLTVRAALYGSEATASDDAAASDPHAPWRNMTPEEWDVAAEAHRVGSSDPEADR